MADNQNKVIEIASKHLGQVGGAGYSDKYDPSLLVAVPRYLNREAYGIDDKDLPFVGGDAWNAYEVSAITKKGLPVSGMLKIWYPSNSPLHVESKSIKLYLNSYNMTAFGESARECIEFIEKQVAKDLSDLLQTKAECRMYINTGTPEFEFEGFSDLEALVDLDQIEFTAFHSDASQLKIWEEKKFPVVKKIHSNLLRSNCRVTNQPDWGDVYIHIEGKNVPDEASLAQYIVSHRQVSHFHEEICEMIFTHLNEAYKPERLMVACLYTRRGGLDINPIRATHKDMIPGWFSSVDRRMKKTLRQ